jgi:hypothetical protein
VVPAGVSDAQLSQVVPHRPRVAGSAVPAKAAAASYGHSRSAVHPVRLVEFLDSASDATLSQQARRGTESEGRDPDTRGCPTDGV